MVLFCSVKLPISWIYSLSFIPGATYRFSPFSLSFVLSGANISELDEVSAAQYTISCSAMSLPVLLSLPRMPSAFCLICLISYCPLRQRVQTVLFLIVLPGIGLEDIISGSEQLVCPTLQHSLCGMLMFQLWELLGGNFLEGSHPLPTAFTYFISGDGKTSVLTMAAPPRTCNILLGAWPPQWQTLPCFYSLSAWPQ